jgi:NADH dehydrogenase
VGPDLTIPGHPEISVVGDVACLDGPGDKPLPGLATVAIQQAHHVAKGIHAGGVGASTPFKYLDKGALAVVGRGKAVCEIRGLRFSGRPAFLTYAGVHLFYLGGQMGRRLEVLFRWVGARFGERQSALIEGELASVERTPRAAEAAQWAQTSSH